MKYDKHSHGLRLFCTSFELANSNYTIKIKVAYSSGLRAASQSPGTGNEPGVVSLVAIKLPLGPDRKAANAVASGDHSRKYPAGFLPLLATNPD